MPRSRTRYKPLRTILSAAEPDVMVQLVRLFILYEDLKLEVAGLHLPGNRDLDEVSEHYREMYFIRRAFATIREIINALEALQRNRDFKQKKRTFDKRTRSEWAATILFFNDARRFIDRQRNAYGGHVNDEVARYVLAGIDQGDDSIGAVEVRISDDHTAHFVFKFAQQLVSQALFLDRGEHDHYEYLERSWDLLTAAVRYSAHAVQSLADVYVMPTFER